MSSLCYTESLLGTHVVSHEVHMRFDLMTLVCTRHARENVCCLQWRQKMRKPDHQLIVQEAGEEVSQTESEPLPGGFRNILQRGQKKDMDVRERTSGILLSDRTESEDQPFE